MTTEERLTAQFENTIFCAPVNKVNGNYEIGGIVFDIKTLESISLSLAISHVNHLYSMSNGNCFKTQKQADEAVERFKKSELENSVLNLLAYISKNRKINTNAKTPREKEINNIAEKYFI